jgi:hypothetical protein
VESSRPKNKKKGRLQNNCRRAYLGNNKNRERIIFRRNIRIIAYV